MAVPTFDAASRFGFSNTSGSGSHTCTGSNRLLHVFTTNRDAGAGDVTGVTYNGVAMTLVVGPTAYGGGWARIWQMVNPPSGANTVAVTLSGVRTTEVHCLSYADADQTTPIGTAVISPLVSGQSISASVTTTADQIAGRYIAYEVTAAGSTGFTADGTAHTERTDGFEGFYYAATGTQTGTGALTGGFTMGVAFPDSGTMFSVPINGITGAPPSAPPTEMLYRSEYARKPALSRWYGTKYPAAGIIRAAFFPAAADPLYIGAAGEATVKRGVVANNVLYLGPRTLF